MKGVVSSCCDFVPFQTILKNFYLKSELSSMGACEKVTDQVRRLQESSLATVAKICLRESINECKTRGHIHLSRSNS